MTKANTPRKYLFIVQGEGRGHMTQAISLHNMLHQAGHTVVAVLVGKSAQRTIPAFFFDAIQAPVSQFESPNFLLDKAGKGIRIAASIAYNLRRLATYRHSLRQIGDAIRTHQPHVVVNFYEPLAGLYYMLYRPGVPLVSIAHQYIFHHPAFAFAKLNARDRYSLKVLTDLTAWGASKRLALSFYPLPAQPGRRHLHVVPPLLRQAVRDAHITPGDYILIYLLNAGYMEEIKQWSQAHPQQRIHCFTDSKDVEGEWAYSPSLSFHRISDTKFVELMAGCRAFASTAGFESVCEALYMGKACYMVPVAGHFEQYNNARDAAHKAGAGIYGDRFDIDGLLDYLPRHSTDASVFRQWADTAPKTLIEHLEEV